MYAPGRNFFLSALPVIGVLFRFDEEHGDTSSAEYKGERSEFTKPLYSVLVLVAVVSPHSLQVTGCGTMFDSKRSGTQELGRTSAACLIPLAGLGNTAKDFYRSSSSRAIIITPTR